MAESDTSALMASFKHLPINGYEEHFYSGGGHGVAKNRPLRLLIFSHRHSYLPNALSDVRGTSVVEVLSSYYIETMRRMESFLWFMSRNFTATLQEKERHIIFLLHAD